MPIAENEEPVKAAQLRELAKELHLYAERLNKSAEELGESDSVSLTLHTIKSQNGPLFRLGAFIRVVERKIQNLTFDRRFQSMVAEQGPPYEVKSETKQASKTVKKRGSSK